LSAAFPGGSAMRFHWKMLALACALFAGACVSVKTKYPIGMTVGLPADSRLYGTWKVQSDDSAKAAEMYVHFVRSNNGSITGLSVDGSGQQEIGWAASQVLTATLGSNHYMNSMLIMLQGMPVVKERYVPELYEIENDTLTLYAIDYDKVKKLVESGRLKGKIEPAKYEWDGHKGTTNAFGTVFITADAEELDAFMATPEAAKLFTKAMVLKKVQ
jgi:hypothetical protein